MVANRQHSTFYANTFLLNRPFAGMKWFRRQNNRPNSGHAVGECTCAPAPAAIPSFHSRADRAEARDEPTHLVRALEIPRRTRSRTWVLWSMCFAPNRAHSVCATYASHVWISNVAQSNSLISLSIVGDKTTTKTGVVRNYVPGGFAKPSL